MDRRGFLKLAGLLLLSGVPPFQVWLPLVGAGLLRLDWDGGRWDGGRAWG